MSARELRYVLAIDLGTSGPKVALVSTNGDVLDCEVEPTGLQLFPGGGAEQDPDDWWRAITTASRRLMDKKIVPVEKIVAVSATTQWSGTVAVNREGRHLMNAIIWMDTRGSAYMEPIVGGFPKVEGYGALKLLRWLRLTGGAPGHSGKDPLAHIHYIKNEHHQVYRDTYKFLEPKDYINLRLTGRFAASFDSIALHWVTDNRDIRNIKYDPGLLRMCGLERHHLPDLGQAVDVLGPILPQAARDLGIGPGAQVIIGTPDVQSASVGSGAVRDYEGHLYIGTSSWLTCHVPFKKTDIVHNMASLPSAVPGRFFVANEQETAGYCLTYLRDNVFYRADDLGTPAPADAYSRFNSEAAKAPPGSEKLIFLPWLFGERTPVEDHSVRGGFFNQSLRTNRSHMIRAVFEGVAYNTRWLLGYVEKFIKRPMEKINLIGGGARSELWCQIMADVLGREIRQVKDPVQANARGAAFLASVALGYHTFHELSDVIQIEKTYTPEPGNRKIYDELFREYLNLYRANRKIYARLNP